MLSHVNKVYSLAFLGICSIGQIRRYLDKDSAEKLVHAFVTSRLDYCNSLLYGLPHKLISKLTEKTECSRETGARSEKTWSYQSGPKRPSLAPNQKACCLQDLAHHLQNTQQRRSGLYSRHCHTLQTCTWSSFSFTGAACCPTTLNKKLWCKSFLNCWTKTLERTASSHSQIPIYRPV